MTAREKAEIVREAIFPEYLDEIMLSILEDAIQYDLDLSDKEKKAFKRVWKYFGGHLDG